MRTREKERIYRRFMAGESVCDLAHYIHDIRYRAGVCVHSMNYASEVEQAIRDVSKRPNKKGKK